MKQLADKHRRKIKFEIGDHVYLKLQPYCFCFLASRPNEKLSPRFYGPYEIEEKIGKVAYRPKLLGTIKFTLFFMFHN